LKYTICVNGAHINGVIAHIISYPFSWNNNALPIKLPFVDTDPFYSRVCLLLLSLLGCQFLREKGPYLISSQCWVRDLKQKNIMRVLVRAAALLREW
jgi:hypothetical protein